MSINLQLIQKTSQQLLMSLQLRQAIQLLSLNNAELQNEIQTQLNENPFLELQEDQPVKKESPAEQKETDFIWTDLNYNGSAEEQDSEPGYLGALLNQEIDLTAQILEQINYADLELEEREALLALINNLDDEGYLNVSLIEVASQVGCSIYCLEKMLDLLKSLEPVGIGAWDLRECLLLQLERNHQNEWLAFQIVAESLQLLAEKKYQQIASNYSVDLTAVLHATKLIQSLEPHPMQRISKSTAKYIIPDLKLIRANNQWLVQINEENLPNIAISDYYLNLINNNLYQSKNEKSFLKKKYKEAGFFLQAIFQRNQTIKLVADCIVRHQVAFFDGSANLKPLILKNIAKELEIHESTVSRAVADKFISTPKGIYPLKYFFTQKSSDKDNAVSAQEVQNQIKELIKQESQLDPISDAGLSAKLSEQGIKIARRTVAKYREELGIPSTVIRKKDYSVKASL